jgi:hypothetical protein
MRVSNASARNELHQLQSKLIGHERMMRQSGLAVGGTHAPPQRRPRDSAHPGCRNLARTFQALARGVRIPE